MKIKISGFLSQNTKLLYNVSTKKKKKAINAIEYTKNHKVQFMQEFDTYNELNFIICILLYFIKCICLLIYQPDTKKIKRKN